MLIILFALLSLGLNLSLIILMLECYVTDFATIIVTKFIFCQQYSYHIHIMTLLYTDACFLGLLHQYLA